MTLSMLAYVNGLPHWIKNSIVNQAEGKKGHGIICVEQDYEASLPDVVKQMKVYGVKLVFTKTGKRYYDDGDGKPYTHYILKVVQL